jgi:hypothetical protein
MLLSEQEAAMLHELAYEYGLTLSDVIRQLIRQASASGIDTDGERNASPPAVGMLKRKPR